MLQESAEPLPRLDPEYESVLEDDSSLPSAEIVVFPGVETEEVREIRERQEQEEIAVIRDGFDAMRTHELVRQQSEIVAGQRAAQPDRPPLTAAGKTIATVEALAKRIGRVIMPSKFDRIASSVIGLNLYKKEKVTETELADGTELRPGDAYARLHLTLERAKPGRPEVDEDWKWVLDELARRVAEDTRYRDI